MTKLGIVCGLAFEAAIIKRAVKQTLPANAPLIACSGPGPSRARTAASILADQGSEALLSFGISGGLDPGLATGTVIIATGLANGSKQNCDEQWSTRLYKSLKPDFDARYAPLAGAKSVLSTTTEKLALFRSSGAAAIDMESSGIAEAAAEKGLPFVALRVICDTADVTIPPIAISAMGNNGRIRILATAFQSSANPSQIPDLVRLARRTADARQVLKSLASFGLLGMFRAFG